MMKAIGVIPARYGSKRFPGKPLALLNGKPMIQWVYEKASKSKYLERVIVATDDVRIMRVVWNFGGEAILTSKKVSSGTDRVAEVSKKIFADIVLNIQGDEPLISPETIASVVRPLLKDKRLLMATAASPFKNESESQSEDTVKVVLDQFGNALYFSRAAIPFHREHRGFRGFFRHYGIYSFRRNFLLRFTKWKQSPLELTESLEQLRALEHGVRIRVALVKQKSFGVDTKDDIPKVKKLL